MFDAVTLLDLNSVRRSGFRGGVLHEANGGLRMQVMRLPSPQHGLSPTRAMRGEWRRRPRHCLVQVA